MMWEQFFRPQSDDGATSPQTTTVEVQADGSVTERVVRTMPDGSRVVEETVRAQPRPPRPSSAARYEQPRHTAAHQAVPASAPRQRYQVSNDPGPMKHEPGCCGDIPTFAAPAECPPEAVRLAKEGMIEWAWCPEWSWLRILLITMIFVAAIGLLLLITGATFGNTGLAIGGLVLGILGGVGLYFVLIWRWNAQKQEAYKLSRGKRLDAIALWEQADPVVSYAAKDTFFEAKYGGKTLKVLRDGTIEVHGTHRNAVAGLAVGETGGGGEMVSSAMDGAAAGFSEG